MSFSKDDLRSAYMAGFCDGFWAYPEDEVFDEKGFDIWFNFVFKDRLDQNKLTNLGLTNIGEKGATYYG